MSADNIFNPNKCLLKCNRNDSNTSKNWFTFESGVQYKVDTIVFTFGSETDVT